MNIYKLTQDTVCGYDTYDRAIVVANNENEAKNIHPNGYGSNWRCCSSWCQPEKVEVELVSKLPKNSKYKSGDVICASFHAG